MKITIDASGEETTVTDFVSSDPLISAYFSRLPMDARNAAFERALRIGVMAMMEDKVAAFLSSTRSELGAHLGNLQLLYEANQIRLKSPIAKGEEGEATIATVLSDFAEQRSLDDSIQMLGRTSGALPRNKTGDIVISLGAEDNAPSIVIECKLDKSVRLGDLATDGHGKGRDTAWSQLAEAKANRNADVGIIVFSADSADNTIGSFTDSVRYIKGLGYVVLIDMARGDYRPLTIAYELAREQAMSLQNEHLDQEVLQVLVHKFCADLACAAEVKKNISNSIASAQSALEQMNAVIAHSESTRALLKSYIENGRLDQKSLLQILAPKKAELLK